MRLFLAACVIIAALLVGGCGKDSPRAPATTPTTSPSACVTPSATGPTPSPDATPCPTEAPVGNADGGDVPDCDLDDMIEGDSDCGTRPTTRAATPTNKPKPKASSKRPRT